MQPPNDKVSCDGRGRRSELDPLVVTLLGALPQSSLNFKSHPMLVKLAAGLSATVAVVILSLPQVLAQQAGPPGHAAPGEAEWIDGRIGKVIDAQGLVSLRPLAHRRWTAVSGRLLVKPNDWVRTDARGAHAATIELTSQVKIILGPGSLMELRSPTELRLHRGEVRVSVGSEAKTPLRLLGPDDQVVSIGVGTAAHYRLDRNDSLVQVPGKPRWLVGYQGDASVDALGSLIANIDGRDTPLSIGFHNVRVEIRDQIARTTIEESFINRTGARLEGVFHFPLPSDASISGFGMWIGDELVEADVVEKQRAREIYETILREKRDPALLEWAGGNLFKARVFPIEPHSEKRIKIVYTQVLPTTGEQYRYAYGLRSEMLQTTPVRELSLDVQIHSAVPIRSVSCPTHVARTQQTKHAAMVQFHAEEYTPERDFEVVCEVDANREPAIVVPHRRGDDGYFLVQLNPPGGDGQWQRALIPDGEPLDLLVVCDTSASSDASQRQAQQAFVAALL